VVIAIESNEDICLSNNVEAINGWVWDSKLSFIIITLEGSINNNVVESKIVAVVRRSNLKLPHLSPILSS
jgi:hypothetical protein